jgi:hypothetical protein
MTILSNITISRKLTVLSVAALIQLACMSGLALWALSDSSAAADKAQQYAHKMDL